MHPLLTFAMAISILVTASMFFPCFLTSDVIPRVSRSVSDVKMRTFPTANDMFRETNVKEKKKRQRDWR